MAVLAQPGRVHLRRSRLRAAPLLPAVASVALLPLVLGSESTSQRRLPSGRLPERGGRRAGGPAGVPVLLGFALPWPHLHALTLSC